MLDNIHQALVGTNVVTQNADWMKIAKTIPWNSQSPLCDGILDQWFVYLWLRCCSCNCSYDHFSNVHIRCHVAFHPAFQRWLKAWPAPDDVVGCTQNATVIPLVATVENFSRQSRSTASDWRRHVQLMGFVALVVSKSYRASAHVAHPLHACKICITISPIIYTWRVATVSCLRLSQKGHVVDHARCFKWDFLLRHHNRYDLFWTFFQTNQGQITSNKQHIEWSFSQSNAILPN